MHSQAILDSWHANAAEWSQVIATNAIASRKLVTNAAIVSAIQQYFTSGTIVDVGCGEGWLSRALHGLQYPVYGVDAIPQLIETAKELAPCIPYYVADYQALATQGLPSPAEAAVCNFCLIDEEHTQLLLAALAKQLTGNKWLFIQTLHSTMANDSQPNKTGWRSGSWDGLPGHFTQPYQWYFRTLESWISLLVSSGFQLVQVLEPLHPETNLPASYIFICKAL
jgi:2-polyprenyl-3-methyl-5-hydroxy-6-metoxy-1,4-benzoquinol methylase